MELLFPALLYGCPIFPSWCHSLHSAQHAQSRQCGEQEMPEETDHTGLDLGESCVTLGIFTFILHQYPLNMFISHFKAKEMSFREAVIYHSQQAAEQNLDPKPWGLLVLPYSFTLNDSDDIKKSRVTKLGSKQRHWRAWKWFDRYS